MAEAAGIPVVLHAYGCLGVGFAAGLQLVASVPNFTLANQEAYYHALMDDVIEGGPIPLRGGRASVPTGPGLGVTLDPDRLQRYSEYYRREFGNAQTSKNMRTLAYTAMHQRAYLRP
jgi:L-alanine-DL-glutamate epimerase-like enolase superfamily enzyme